MLRTLPEDEDEDMHVVWLHADMNTRLIAN